MEITYKIVGLKKLQAATRQAPGILSIRTNEAMHRSVELVESLARIGSPEGPGHFGYHESERWSTRVRSGPRRLVGVVSNSAAQARWREFGTQAHDIRPKSAAALKIGGRFVSFAHHPGVKAKHTGKKALTASRSAITVFFTDALKGVTQSLATSGD
jgi:hypothetical protein